MKRSIVLVVVFSVLSLAGCSLLTQKTPQEEMILQLSVQSAVAHVQHDHPDWKTPTINISQALIDAIDGKTVIDLGSLSAYAKSKVPMDKLLPTEQALASLLIDTIIQNVKSNLEMRGVTTPSAQMVEARQVLVWINDISKI